MSMPGMWWGRDDEGLAHAVSRLHVAAALERGFTEALCGAQLPVDVALLSAPDEGPVCGPCHFGATADVDSFPPLAPFGRS